MIKVAEKEYCDFNEAIASLNNDEETIIDLNGACINKQTRISHNNLVIKNGIFTNNLGAYEILADGYKRGTFRTYTLFIDADNIRLENVEVLNTSDYHNGQAIALMIDGDNFKAKNCKISSYQDTLFIGPLPEKEYEERGFVGPLEKRKRIKRQAKFVDCLIEGSVDFIFGGGNAYFLNSEICNKKVEEEQCAYVCAPCTPENSAYGFIFDECHFTSEANIEDSVYLARPWRDYAKCFIANSTIGAHIRKEGYHDWNKIQARKTCEFKEYNNLNYNEAKRVTWMKQVNKKDLDKIKKLKEEEISERDLQKNS